MANYRPMRKVLSVVLLLAGALLVAGSLKEYAEAASAQRWALAALAADPGRAPSEVAIGEPVAQISIPRIGLHTVALEGVDLETLRNGPGHFPHSPLPGEPGNSAFAGHRDTHFAPLREVAVGDRIEVRREGRTVVYLVSALRVVEPEEVEVVGPDAGADLTLVTCHPFDWIGPAPRRFIVHARLVEVADRPTRP